MVIHISLPGPARLPVHSGRLKKRFGIGMMTHYIDERTFLGYKILFLMPSLNPVMCKLAFLMLLVFAEAAKLRPWLGPDSFLEGDLPSARYRNRLASTEDGKVYLFGGGGHSGIWQSLGKSTMILPLS